jgi:hypothetical protein
VSEFWLDDAEREVEARWQSLPKWLRDAMEEEQAQREEEREALLREMLR